MRTAHAREQIAGTFQQIIYSPHGSIEGVMIDASEGKTQLVFVDDAAGAILRGTDAGTDVVAQGEFVGWSSSKNDGHRVYLVEAVTSINGKKPRKPPAMDRAPAYCGKVVGFNYARHGEPNGVILDSGDFIHVKPEGFKRLKLAIGDTVEAYGDGHELHAERGYVVEASRVNGKKIG